MATPPRLFNSQLCYHVYNCGVERRSTFTNSNDYNRFLEIILFYLQVQKIPFSQFYGLEEKQRLQYLQNNPLTDESRRVAIFSYCLMPNHFHFILKPEKDFGISRFISDITNSYTKYFNTRYKRIGHLFQGSFKAKEVSTEASLFQLSRYIHLNPVLSTKVNWQAPLWEYPYSSYVYWIRGKSDAIIKMEDIKKFLPSYTPDSYEEFVDSKILGDSDSALEGLILEKADV